MAPLKHRSLLITLSAICLSSLPNPAQAELEREVVDLNYVAEQARQLMESGTRTEYKPTSECLRNIDYDGYRNIRFRPSEAVWADQDLPFRAEFFHLGHIFNQPVEIFETSETHLQLIPFIENFFDYRQSDYEPSARDRPSGYAGVRIKHPLNREDIWDDLIVFQGASYFRALGKSQSYGLSFRGLSMGMVTGDESFPRFTKIWLKKPESNSKELTVFALLEGQEVTGAYQFVIYPKTVTEISVSARLYFAEGAEQKVGLSPLTSMFLFGENTNVPIDDWRPEVHDSDGLIIRADDQTTWHALNNLPGRHIKTFPVGKLFGFGLSQRDRSFDHYEDTEAKYESRPSAWVTPGPNWPRGNVVLYTFNTDTEATDNVNVFWKPDIGPDFNGTIDLDYTISLRLEAPPSHLAQVEKTMVGQKTMDPSATTIVIDFQRPQDVSAEMIDTLNVNFNWGTADLIEKPILIFNEAEDEIKVIAHFRRPPSPPEEPYEMTAELMQHGHRKSENWSYSWRP